MTNQLYFCLTKSGMTRSGLPRWAVVAASTSYFNGRDSYDGLGVSEKVMLAWDVEDGVQVLRADLDGSHFSQGFNNLEVPFSALPPHDRAGMHVPVCNAVVNFLKDGNLAPQEPGEDEGYLWSNMFIGVTVFLATLLASTVFRW